MAVTVEGAVLLHDPDADAASWLRDAWRERFGTVLDWHGTVIELIPDRVLSTDGDASATHRRVVGAAHSPRRLEVGS